MIEMRSIIEMGREITPAPILKVIFYYEEAPAIAAATAS